MSLYISLEERRLRVDMKVLFKSLKGCPLEVRTNLFSPASESRTTSNMYKLQGHLDIKKKFLTVKTDHQWSKLWREVVDSPSLEFFK